MRGVTVPSRTEDFTADPVELFFDLAFVFAFSQLVKVLVEDHTWGGVGRAALLFLMLWLPWTQFTWSANAVSGNGRVVRTLFLLSTVASIPMAASVTSAYEGGGTAFATSLSFILLMALATMALPLERGSAERRSAFSYASYNALSVVVLVGGSFLQGDARILAWVAGLLIVTVGTVLAGRGTWIIRMGHFSERHGLIIIVALGEIIVAIATPVVERLEEGQGLAAGSLMALLASGTFATLLWWAYFDRSSPAFEHHGKGMPGDEIGRYVRDVYTYWHAPVVAGVILAAAALEEISLHPDEAVPTAFRLMLAAGLAMFMLGITGGVRRAFSITIIERPLATGAVAALCLLLATTPGLTLLLVIDAVLLATLVAEHFRVEGLPTRA